MIQPPARKTSLLLPHVCAVVCLGLLVSLTGASPVRAADPALITANSPEAHYASREIDRLFEEEMNQASAKLKWRGERLADDTIYAIALTGTSWEPAWNRDPLFSLAWGDLRKVPTLGKRIGKNYAALADQIRQLYAQKEYRKTVDAASASFSLDEIGCDTNLKEPVGDSLLALGQPEQAFPILSAPFEPSRNEIKDSEENYRFRQDAFEAAQKAGLKKEAVVFALSLLLAPDPDTARVDTNMLDYLLKAGVDVDRVLLGILQAPEKLRGLPGYSYAAADLMAYRASPRLLPFLLQLAESNDAYLRSRALLGLGMVAYQPRNGDPAGWADKVIFAVPREYGISVGERRLVDKALRDGVNSDKYRVRVAAALALGLVGDPDNLPLLQKLAKDRVYVLLLDPKGGESSRARHILFPVRMAASAALARYGVSLDPGGGVLAGKELDRAKHGGEDQTNDRRNLHHDVASQIQISPLDVATPIPIK